MAYCYRYCLLLLLLPTAIAYCLLRLLLPTAIAIAYCYCYCPRLLRAPADTGIGFGSCHRLLLLLVHTASAAAHSYCYCHCLLLLLPTDILSVVKGGTDDTIFLAPHLQVKPGCIAIALVHVQGLVRAQCSPLSFPMRLTHCPPLFMC